ncbi:hypothetical protein [Pontibacter russatus]|uniref:hypothetical protein n=1 Tax=Pontibacter russatus TaxID=2694929 RepID=UPI00137AC14C|nr:hypothetical protein [Pontibacter russatus]
MSVLFQTCVYVNREEKPDLTGYSIIALLVGLILYVIAPDKWYAVPFMMISAAMTYFQRFYLDSGKQKLHGYLGRYLTFQKEGVLIEGKFYP